MSRNVIVSKLAEEKLEILFEYLIKKWSIKVKNDFITKLDQSLSVIKEYPESFPESEKEKGLRKCVITKQTSLYYRFDKTQIKIITIFDTRQNPNKLNPEIK
jgi:plasmid stabilization system protein ParE